MQISKDQIVRSLLKKGFKEEECKHHRQFFHVVDGRETGIKTFISHSPGIKVYGDELLAKMKGQLKLHSKKDFIDLLNCPLSAEGYIAKLQENGEI